MCEITFDPGKFDNLCGPLVDSFAATLNDASYTRPLIEAIVNQVCCCSHLLTKVLRASDMAAIIYMYKCTFKYTL